MTRLSTWLLAAGVACGAAMGLVRPADAALYGFTIAAFTDGATLTVEFTGEDTNGDGVIYGYHPPDCGCTPDPTEVTSLSLAFSGNSVIPAFAAASTNFSDLGQPLWFDPEYGDGFELFYVLNAAGSGVAFFEMPPGVVNNDAALYLVGLVDDTLIQITGAPCGSVLGLYGGDPEAPCAVLS
jgi:hypothetical protein